MNNIGIFLQSITGDIVLKLLTIHHLRLVSVETVNLYSAETINFLNDEWSFPFREQFSCKKSETRHIQKYFVTNIKFSFQNSLIMPSLYFFLKQTSTLISLIPPLIQRVLFKQPSFTGKIRIRIKLSNSPKSIFLRVMCLSRMRYEEIQLVCCK